MPTGFIHDGLAPFDAIGAGLANARDQPRPRDDLAALGNLRGEVRLLQRRDRDRPLADAHADGFARKPHLVGLALEGVPLPLRRGIEAGLLAGNVDAGELAVAEGVHEGRHPLDLEPVGDAEEVDVAGDADGVAHVQTPPCFLSSRYWWALPGMVKMPGQNSIWVRRQDAVRLGGQRIQGLHRRTRRIGAAQRAVQERHVDVVR